MDIGALTATLGVNAEGLRSAEGQMRAFGASAESTFNRAGNQAASTATQFAKLAAVVTTLYVSYQKLSDFINIGMKMETMEIVMLRVGKNVGISADALKYFTEQVKSSGITTMESMSTITKAMQLGLNLNQMKELATRARDVAVAARDQATGALLNTSETLQRIMHGIQSGHTVVLRTLGITVREMDVVYKEYAESIGRTSSQLNVAHKRQAMLNEVMKASVSLAGAAADADESVGKQLASMARYSEEAKVALWDLFKPGMEAGVVAMTTAFKELKKWADDNNKSLKELGIQIGAWIGQVAVATINTVKWIVSNFELVKSLAQFYIIYKIVGWTIALKNALVALYATMVAGEVTTATVNVIRYGGALGGVAGMARVAQVQVAAAGGAAASSGAMAYGAVAGWMALGKAIVIAGAAFLVYKTFSKPDMSVEAGPGSHAVMSGHGAEPAPEPSKRGPLASPEFVQAQRMVRFQQKYIEEGNAAALNALQKGMDSAGKGKGGGKGAEAAESSLKSFIDTMISETARGAGDSDAILNAWYGKQLSTLEKLAAKGIDITRGKEALDEAYFSKLEKLNRDFNDWYISGVGSQYDQLMVAEEKKLAEVVGNAEKTAKVREYYDRKYYDANQQMETERLGLFKGYLDTMAGLSPIMADQLDYKKQALELELKLADIALERFIEEKNISGEQADQARSMQALVAQAKKYNQERERWRTQGYSGGLKIAYEDSRDTAATWQAEQVSSYLKSAPQQISQTMASSFIDYLKGNKMDFEALGYSIAEATIQKHAEGFLTQLMPLALEGLMTLLGIELPAKQTAAMTAAETLTIGGVNAGIAMVNGAIQAAAILSGSKSGGGLENMLGGFVKIAGSLFGTSIGSSIGAPSYSPSSDTSWGNAAYSSWLTRHSGGMLLPYAHSGLKLSSDEVPFIGLTGERVLSRQETRDYERGGRETPQVNVIIYPPANTEAKAETKSNGDVIVTFDQIAAAAYNRRGSLYKAINSGGGATKR